jgi:hypothetical protein
MLLATLAQAGCQSAAGSYLRNGIGADLPARDIASATTNQNRYFAYLCQQIGRAGTSADGTPIACTVADDDERGWTLIVQQGMNDIDRRCDAYLEWLDNQKRSRGPVQGQLRDVQNATTAIMAVIDPGSAAALNIVVQAFGLLSKSIENYHSRLLLEIETSTINSVVLNAQRAFRHQLVRNRVRFNNRPDAEYALREYLRQCLPFAIESQINDLSTLGSQGVAPSSARTIFVEPVGSVIRRDTPASSLDRIGRTRANAAASGISTSATGPDLGGDSAIEKRFSLAELERLQRNLCTSVTGTFDDSTRMAIGDMQDGLAVTRTERIDGNAQKAIALSVAPACENFANAYEKFRFRAKDGESAAQRIEAFQANLKECADLLVEASGGTLAAPVAPTAIQTTGALDGQTRQMIGFVLANVANAESAGATGVLSRRNMEAIGTCAPKA